MANNTYKIEYATAARAVCKLAACKQKIEKGEIRIGKTYPNDRFTEGGTMTDWYHAPCIFQHLKKARKTTKKIDSEDDLENFSHMHANDQKTVSGYIQAFAQGEDIENPYVAGGGEGGEKKAKAPAKKKAKAPEPVIPAHLLAGKAKAKPKPKPKAKAKKTEKRTVEVELFRARILKEGSKKPIYLPMDSSPLVLGRGDVTGITDKRCSRTQLELVASQEEKKVYLTMLGNNPTSFVFGEDGEPEPLTKGQRVELPHGSRFILFVDDTYVVQLRTDKVPQEIEVEVEEEEEEAVDEEATDEDEELQKQAALASKKRKAPTPSTSTSTKAPTPAKKPKTEPPKKPKAPPKKKAKKKKGGDIDLDGTIDSDDDGQPNEYDYGDGFLVPNDASLGEEDEDDDGAGRHTPAKKRRAARYENDDEEAVREAKKFLQGFEGDDDYEGREKTHTPLKNGKPVCRYGAKCYRVNADHRKQFWHPSKNESSAGGDGSGDEERSATPRRPSPPPSGGRGGVDERVDELSEEEEQSEQRRGKDREAEGKVRTLRAMHTFRELDEGVIRDVLEANYGSLHLTMEALKLLI